MVLSLSFLDLEGEAHTVSVDIIWIRNVCSPLFYEMFWFTRAKRLLNQWHKRRLHCRGVQEESWSERLWRD